MKKFVRILVSLMLSVMVVSLGAGVAIVNCSHSGRSSAVSLSMYGGGGKAHCASGGERCGGEERAELRPSDCMSVTVAKLAASGMAQSGTHHFDNLSSDASFLVGAFFPYVSVSQAGGSSFAFVRDARLFTSLPRSYLRLLRVLRL